MKKLCMLLMFVLPMAMSSHHALAQEVTITLNPGCTWISYLGTEPQDFATALGSFTPEVGDVIKSQWGNATYRGNGQWKGSITQFYPGYGYMYKSTRSYPVTLTLTPQQPVPQVVVTTSEPMLITAISAMGGGEVTVNDGTYIIVKGLCWATHQNPTTNDGFFQEAESGVGSFSLSMTGLNMSTTYYVRAYAVTPNGTVYGDQKTFITRDGIPTLTTSDITNITAISAISGGNITDNGGLSITARGVCWSTSSDTTISNNHTSNETGTGDFISSITGLNDSTTYYVRAYATTNAGTAYGNEVSFTTRDGIPTLTTTDVTNIGGRWATSGGNITDDEGLSVIARGVCWSTIPDPTVNDSHTTNGTGTGVFSSYITGLDVNTVYYVRAYATTSAGTGYGEQKSFETENLWVDLGLPSGLLWATCNVGAATPEGRGDHFAWGETEPKDYADCYWGRYQYCEYYYDEGHEWHGLTKYCSNPNYGYYGFVDNLTILFPEDDGATTNWGNDWRMPTEEEWQELCTNTTCTWTTQNGVSGRLFTASNGNSLFLPETGGCWAFNFMDYWKDYRHETPTPIEGDYWSSSLCAGYPSSAGSFYFSSDNYSVSSNARCNGLHIRAVHPVSQTFIINTTVNSFGGGATSGGSIYQEGAECSLTATAHENYTFINWTENGEEVSTDANYTFTVNSNRILVANFTYSGDVYVDLGLPSGLLWATYNVGANGPEDYGDYFAWGETEPKSTYTEANYTYGDNPAILPPEHDAATANWGADWRMPTYEEWQELYNYTTNTWTIQNGVKGQLFTASNGSSIFLPATGYRGEGDLPGLPTFGSLGHYWSSSHGASFNALSFIFGNYHYEIPYYDNRYCGSPVRPVRFATFIDASATPVDGGEVSGSGTFQEGAECTLTATANEGYTFVNWTENDSVVSTDATYTFIVSAGRTLVANFTYNGEYVDLGLPSGLLWATCNVGADNPEDYGDYFAWGETQPKDTYYWSTYQYCMGSENTLTKYCDNPEYGYNGFADNLTTLLLVDDAATANWGSGWRKPTKEEWQELYNNTTCTWTTQNGVNGRLFTASNGSSLFLPAAGYRWDNELYSAGEGGYYWSSSLRTYGPARAWDFHFDSGSTDVYYYYRRGGQSVRAVRSAPLNFVIDASVTPVDGGEVSGSGIYQMGAECTLTTTTNEGYTFVNWMENDSVVSTDATYTFTVNANRTLVANFTYNAEYVDLGLPSGLLWATCNVGAGTPEGYGDNFAWGETQPKDTYNWSTYQYCNGVCYSYYGTITHPYLTRYCTDPEYGYYGFYDNLTTLLSEDDAATANWGNGWRMPTYAEWQELYNNTTVTWTTQNGVNGRLFTASNGNSLFLPAAGYRNDNGLLGAGSGGNYWSSSLYFGMVDEMECGPDYAGRFRFGSGYIGVYGDLRYCGLSVRPVRSSQN